VDWIDLSQESDKWRVLMNAVMTFGFRKVLGHYRAATHLRSPPPASNAQRKSQLPFAMIQRRATSM
jgi:hypothetical protein